MREDFKTALAVSDDFACATVGPPQKPTPSPRITLRLTEEENAKLRDLAAGMSVSA